MAHLSVRAGKEMSAFLASGLTFIALVALIFQGIFPRVMIATNPAHSILIKNASSTGYTLKTMTIITLVILHLYSSIWAGPISFSEKELKNKT